MANQEKFRRILVRCWPLQLPSADGHIENGHFITYPDGFGGNVLFTCTGCGHLYAANVEMACLGQTLEEKIRGGIASDAVVHSRPCYNATPNLIWIAASDY